MKINELLSETKQESQDTQLESDSRYLTGKDKVDKISPVLGSKSKKQKELMNKSFGSD